MAVEDLISVTVDRQAGATPETMTPAIDELRRHYNGLMYRAILSCTKTSLNVIKQRVCSKVRTVGDFDVHQSVLHVLKQHPCSKVYLSRSA